MLKISQTGIAAQSVTLKLEGRIVGPWVGELCRLCETLLSHRSPLNLDLTDVRFADADGVTALLGLKSRGVILTNASPFLEEQLKTRSTD